MKTPDVDNFIRRADIVLGDGALTIQQSQWLREQYQLIYNAGITHGAYTAYSMNPEDRAEWCNRIRNGRNNGG